MASPTIIRYKALGGLIRVATTYTNRNYGIDSVFQVYVVTEDGYTYLEHSEVWDSESGAIRAFENYL